VYAHLDLGEKCIPVEIPKLRVSDPFAIMGEALEAAKQNPCKGYGVCNLNTAGEYRCVEVLTKEQQKLLESFYPKPKTK